MAILFKDRVKDTSTSTGTTDFTLAGSAPSGFQTFNSAYGTGSTNQFYYCIDGGAEWEVGISYLSASTTLVRNGSQTVLASNTGSAVSFSAGSKTVYSTLPAKSCEENLIKRSRTVLTDAQIKALPTTGIELIPALGAGKLTFVMFAVLRHDWVANYTNINAAAEIQIVNNAVNLIAAVKQELDNVKTLLAYSPGEPVFMFLGPMQLSYLPSAPYTVYSQAFGGNYDSDIVNKAVKIQATNGGSGDFTGGNASNALYVDLVYQVFDFN